MLTEKDMQGNWCVKGLPWKNLNVGTPITKKNLGKIIWLPVEADGV